MFAFVKNSLTSSSFRTINHYFFIISLSLFRSPQSNQKPHVCVSRYPKYPLASICTNLLPPTLTVLQKYQKVDSSKASSSREALIISIKDVPYSHW